MCWLLSWLLARLITDIVLCRVRNCFLVFCKGTTEPSVHPKECCLLIIIYMGDKYHSSSLSLCAILHLRSSSLAAVFCLVRSATLNNYINVIWSMTSIDKKPTYVTKPIHLFITELIVTCQIFWLFVFLSWCLQYTFLWNFIDIYLSRTTSVVNEIIAYKLMKENLETKIFSKWTNFLKNKIPTVGTLLNLSICCHDS